MPALPCSLSLTGLGSNWFIKARLNGFDFCLTFLSTNLSEKCWVCLNSSLTLSKELKKVKSLSNRSQIKFELDQTVKFPYNFSFVLKKFGQNCLHTLSKFLFVFCLTFTQCWSNECWAKSKPFKWASMLLVVFCDWQDVTSFSFWISWL